MVRLGDGKHALWNRWRCSDSFRPLCLVPSGIRHLRTFVVVRMVLARFLPQSCTVALGLWPCFRPLDCPCIAVIFPARCRRSRKMHFSRLAKRILDLFQLCWCSWPQYPRSQPQMHFPRPAKPIWPWFQQISMLSLHPKIVLHML